MSLHLFEQDLLMAKWPPQLQGHELTCIRWMTSGMSTIAEVQEHLATTGEGHSGSLIGFWDLSKYITASKFVSIQSGDMDFATEISSYLYPLYFPHKKNEGSASRAWAELPQQYAARQVPFNKQGQIWGSYQICQSECQSQPFSLGRRFLHTQALRYKVSDGCWMNFQVVYISY